MNAIRLRLMFTSVAALAALVAAPRALAPTIPLCPGLTVVTAVSQSDGDYESIKTVESITDSEVRLKYSVERLVDDLLSSGPPKLEKFTIHRTIRRSDLQSATLYLQQFSTDLPELVPETTAIGTSAAVLDALKTKGESKLGIFIAFSQGKNSIDREHHPNVYDNQMVATVARDPKETVPFRVLVNDAPVDLPAIQAKGDFFGDKTELLFLDDRANPLTLKYRFGIGQRKAMDPVRAKALGVKPQPEGDTDVFQVVKIAYRCEAPPPPKAPPGQGAPGQGAAGAGAPGAEGAGALEQALASAGKVDVYSIYFSFNSDVIRDESEPTLKDIAEVLRRHPDWKLGINGHTDGIGADKYNLDLSRRRAEAVRSALAARYGIAATRLTTAGFGKSQPKDTNDTVEGRARNRRVELVKLG